MRFSILNNSEKSILNYLHYYWLKSPNYLFDNQVKSQQYVQNQSITFDHFVNEVNEESTALNDKFEVILKSFPLTERQCRPKIKHKNIT